MFNITGKKSRQTIIFVPLQKTFVEESKVASLVANKCPQKQQIPNSAQKIKPKTPLTKLMSRYEI